MPPIDTLSPAPEAPVANTLAGTVFDLETTTVTALNTALHEASASEFSVLHPSGKHNLAVGLMAPLVVRIEGHAGYYCGGMNQRATIEVTGNVSSGVGENMMSGRIVVGGTASQAAAATAHGGLLIVRGDAGARCGISLKGADVVVEGSVGQASGFMAQSGRLLVCGDAGDALGDSLYEAKIFVRGNVAGLGADCIEKEMRPEHLDEVQTLLAAAGRDDLTPSDFRRYGSARELYHFTADRVEA